MSYIGKWVFHSIASINDDDECIFLNAEEYLNSSMPYVDETDEEAVADEMRERQQMVRMQIKVCEDGKLYVLMPIPEGISKKELQEVLDSGAFELCDGMLTEGPLTWEDRDGELWFDSGFGDGTMTKATGEGEFFMFATMRFVKID